MTKLPFLLLYSRLVIGFAILLIAISQINGFTTIAILLVTIGLLTDIFDGIAARYLAVSSQKFRRLDSIIDQVFFSCVVIATYLRCPEFYNENKVQILALVGLEGLTYLISYIKFRKEIATHTIGAKIWTLVLFATLIQLIYQCQSDVLFIICFWLGVLTRVEIIGITLILKRWTNDVPTLIHSIKLRQGREIKRHKLFNG